MHQPVLGLLRQPATILVGRGQRHALPHHLPSGARQALIVTDARMAQEPAFTAMMRQLRDSGIHCTTIADVQPELPVADILAAKEKLADERVDVVVGIGGGTCMDFAKVIAILLTHGGKPQDYYGEFAVPGPTVPVIAIPTTAGTGSEATPVAVVSDPDREMKVGISSPYIVPVTAICDPELSDGAPPALTAAVGTDALSHAIESFTAIQRPATPLLGSERVFVGKSLLTDQYALAATAAIGRSLKTAVKGDTDPERLAAARDDMVFAAMAGGLALGTGGTAAAHALQYPVGAATHTPHGVGVGVLLPYVMEFNRPARVAEFATLARAMNVGSGQEDDEQLSHLFIDHIAGLLTAIGIPTTLDGLGMPQGKERWLATQAMKATRLVENNPRTLDIDALETIAAAAYRGDRQLVHAATATR
ncbi:iron-containing alcohol dehydrogenase [Arthrobacter sp. FW306-07-I]|uniref:iron-containing alcohol dehydrogenase n=1 Tax=Arthrobacter sp. FW306-07-I TaxID=2879622 RepID=UPI001F2EE190|nr:iron-containing alcohol dehydrogenase [Arthrobacter sp. FW306-07-I]UKA76186.1 iron-containing alcohol dehydrogenase [Arthrobacter sp. FW306-07-I]